LQTAHSYTHQFSVAQLLDPRHVVSKTGGSLALNFM
jgi:hypothetical protein